jgi:NAD(P)-dependent dehydrogenase (short-subunit alcohol dehydrogenase family)
MAAEGFDVLATGRDERALGETAELAPKPVETARLDVTDSEAVESLFSNLDVDVLVTNAGIAVSALVHRTTLEDWERVLSVNATGPFLCIRAVVPGMVARGWGRIITVGSMTSHYGPKYVAAYAASKHAVLGLTRAVASEVAGTGVTINTVSPAYVDTPMTATSIEKISSVTHLDADSAREESSQTRRSTASRADSQSASCSGAVVAFIPPASTEVAGRGFRFHGEQVAGTTVYLAGAVRTAVVQPGRSPMLHSPSQCGSVPGGSCPRELRRMGRPLRIGGRGHWQGSKHG